MLSFIKDGLTVSVMSVRPATPEDITPIYRMLSSVIREGGYLMSDEPPEPDHFCRFMEANMAIGAPVWVALKGTAVVGWCDVHPRGPDVQRHVGKVGMGVMRSHRGRGLGGRLLAAAVEHAWDTGFTRLELDVFADNQPAIRLYETCGFAREGFHPCVRLCGGAYQDALTMGLLHPGLRS